ncbi:hypothetical protein BHE74_00033908 [Ensete ventricosum]|nr:hypothetical protein BHE74_00033908 [Ensete ventricosum]
MALALVSQCLGTSSDGSLSSSSTGSITRSRPFLQCDVRGSTVRRSANITPWPIVREDRLLSIFGVGVQMVVEAAIGLGMAGRE